jgi:hypothetical protein
MMSNPHHDILFELGVAAGRTTEAAPFARVDGAVLRRAIKEIETLRAELAGRQVRVTKTIFDDGPGAA